MASALNIDHLNRFIGKLESFSWKIHIDVCLLSNRLLSSLYMMWPSIKIPLNRVYLLIQTKEELLNVSLIKSILVLSCWVPVVQGRPVSVKSFFIPTTFTPTTVERVSRNQVFVSCSKMWRRSSSSWMDQRKSSNENKLFYCWRPLKTFLFEGMSSL